MIGNVKSSGTRSGAYRRRCICVALIVGVPAATAAHDVSAECEGVLNHGSPLASGAFVSNEGQWATAHKFIARHAGGILRADAAGFELLSGGGQELMELLA